MIREKGGLVCLLNCAANSSRARELEEQLAQAFENRGATAKFLVCDGDNLRALADRAVADGADTLIAAGGDGTVSTVAAAAVRSQVAFGVVPAGTLNHFAKDSGIPLALDAAIEAILARKILAVDVGEVNGHIFVNNSSIGLYPHIVQQRQAWQDQGAGKWPAFLQAAAFALYRFAKLNIRLVAPGSLQQSVRTPFVFIGNNRYEITGLKAGSRPRLDGGQLWVHAAPDTGRARLIWLALKTLAGLASSREWHVLESGKVEIDFHKRVLKVSIDGEVIQLQSPLHYRVWPGALRLIVPAEAAG